jgi:hypothetical protein
MRLFFLMIPKPLKQHSILKKYHPFRYFQGFGRKTSRLLNQLSNLFGLLHVAGGDSY